MKPLDRFNLPSVWNVGAIIGILGIIGTVLTNQTFLANLTTLLTTGPIVPKLAALGIILGIIATAIGKPPQTSPGVNKV